MQSPGNTGAFCRFASKSQKKGMGGWGTWIRTKIDGVRVRCSTVELSPTSEAKLKAGLHFEAVFT